MAAGTNADAMYNTFERCNDESNKKVHHCERNRKPHFKSDAMSFARKGLISLETSLAVSEGTFDADNLIAE